ARRGSRARRGSSRPRTHAGPSDGTVQLEGVGSAFARRRRRRRRLARGVTPAAQAPTAHAGGLARVGGFPGGDDFEEQTPRRVKRGGRGTAGRGLLSKSIQNIC